MKSIARALSLTLLATLQERRPHLTDEEMPWRDPGTSPRALSEEDRIPQPDLSAPHPTACDEEAHGGLSEPKIPEVGSAQFLRFVDAWSREVEGSLPRANLLYVGGRKEPRATGGSWIRPRDEQALHRRSE